MGKKVIINSNLKEYAKAYDKQLFISGDFPERLNQKVIEMIRDAAKRAKENQRTTIMARDL
ncbi:DUF1931 domain-containing protein [Candidatus Woesearchaeota archaeon]|nr:DUF1931 domain-containing protein [Candidatus Woesearchaeota archaeon]